MEKYSVQKVIGEGSFGRALLVRRKDSQETLVVKEIQLPKVFTKVMAVDITRILTMQPGGEKTILRK